MGKRYLKNMEKDELWEVIEMTPELRRIVEDHIADEMDYYASDVLHGIPSRTEYRIGAYAPCYIYFGDCDAHEVIRYLRKVQRDFGLFDDVDMAKLDKYEKYAWVIDEDNYGHIHVKIDDWTNLWRLSDKIKEHFQHKLARILSETYDFSDCVVKEEAFEYAEDLFEGYYLDMVSGDVFEHRADRKVRTFGGVA